MKSRRVGVAAACALVILAVLTSTAMGATPWTRIDSLLVNHEAYVLGTLEVDGAMTLDGAITAGGGIDLNGSDLTIDADGDSILDETSDDVLAMTLGGGTGYLNVLTGNLAVGNGTPGVTLNGEDAYVEGTFEVDGAATFDGAVTANANLDMNGTTLYLGADQGIYMDEVTDGDYRFVMGAGTDVISYTVGNVAIGNGKPTSAQTGEDLYVEGMLEVDSVLYSDGNTYIGGSSYFSTNTIYADSDSDITIQGSSNNLALTTVSTGTVQVAVGSFKVGNGTPTVSQDGEDAYVEGQLEVDGEAQLDGALDANGTADFADAVVMNSTLKVTGAMNFVMDAAAITTDTIVTAADSGTFYALKNEDTDEVVVSLPAAAAGLNYCFYVYDGDDVSIDAADGDTIHHYTNAASDDIENSTEGDWACMFGLDADTWIVYSVEGTWTDD